MEFSRVLANIEAPGGKGPANTNGRLTPALSSNECNSRTIVSATRVSLRGSLQPCPARSYANPCYLRKLRLHLSPQRPRSASSSLHDDCGRACARTIYVHLQSLDGIDIAGDRITLMLPLHRRQIPKRQRQQKQYANRRTYSSKTCGTSTERAVPRRNRLCLRFHRVQSIGRSPSITKANWAYDRL